MEQKQRMWWGIGIVVAVLLIAWIWWINTPAAAATVNDGCYADEQMPYTQVQGSAIFSLFMLPGMLAIGAAGAAATPEWACTTKIAVVDSVGGALKVRKVRDRGQVEPY